MDGLFLVLAFLSLVGVVVALINPNILRLRTRPIGMLVMAAATFVFLMLFLVVTPDQEEVAEESTEEVVADVEEEPEEETATEKSTDESEEEQEAEDENMLNEDEIKEIKSVIEDSMENDRDMGDVYYLDDFEYDKESNRLKLRIEMRQDPLPTKQDIIDYAKGVVWYTDSQMDKDVDIKVSSVIKVDDGYGVFGRATNKGSDITFKEDKAMQLFD